MKNRRFTTKVVADGDENETTISVNNDHLKLTLVRWYYGFPLRDFGAGNKLPVSQKVEGRFKKIRPERTSPAAKI